MAEDTRAQEEKIRTSEEEKETSTNKVALKEEEEIINTSSGRVQESPPNYSAFEDFHLPVPWENGVFERSPVFEPTVKPGRPSVGKAQATARHLPGMCAEAESSSSSSGGRSSLEIEGWKQRRAVKPKSRKKASTFVLSGELGVEETDEVSHELAKKLEETGAAQQSLEGEESRPVEVSPLLPFSP